MVSQFCQKVILWCIAEGGLGGGFFLFVIFTPGEMIQFDEHIFQMGWFNHQLAR